MKLHDLIAVLVSIEPMTPTQAFHKIASVIRPGQYYIVLENGDVHVVKDQKVAS